MKYFRYAEREAFNIIGCPASPSCQIWGVRQVRSYPWAMSTKRE